MLTVFKFSQVEKLCIYTVTSWEFIREIRSVTCHMRSHSVTRHPTQVNAFRFKPRHLSQIPGGMEGWRLSLVAWP